MKRYGSQFRALRRYLQQYMGSSLAMAHHQPLQELETRQFLLRLLDKPVVFKIKFGRTFSLSHSILRQMSGELMHKRSGRLTGSLILKMSHGYTTAKDGKDPLIRLADEVSSEFLRSAQAGTWLVDFLPFCKLCAIDFIIIC